MINAFFLALSFLTRIPVPTIQYSTKDWQKSVHFYPFVGLIIGGMMALLSILLKGIFPMTIIAFLTVCLWIWITGGLHLDGLMDLADGLGSNRTRDQMLDIMKDSRVGAMGVIAAVLLIAGKAIAIYELLHMQLIFVLMCTPLFARFLLLLTIKTFPYKKEAGLGQGLGRYLTTTLIIVHIFYMLLFTFFVLHGKGLILLLSVSIFSFLFTWFIFKKLCVLTGDCYGALIEWTECTTLFIAIAIWRLLG